jgi:hypothetical protein
MDLLGREVTELVNGDKAAGNFSVDWDASSHASGTYVVRMTFQADPQTAGETQVFSRRITLIR